MKRVFFHVIEIGKSLHALHQYASLGLAEKFNLLLALYGTLFFYHQSYKKVCSQVTRQTREQRSLIFLLNFKNMTQEWICCGWYNMVSQNNMVWISWSKSLLEMKHGCSVMRLNPTPQHKSIQINLLSKM